MSDAPPPISSRFFERIALNTDLSRAFRTALAFGISLAVFHATGHPADGIFVAFTAQTIALQDLRGAYGMRLVILAAMVLVAACAVMFGVAAGGKPVIAVLAMGGIAVMSGAWRQLSADYGPPMAVSSALLFLLGTALPPGSHNALHLAGLVLLGGLCTGLLHVCFWLFRPQHPLRHAVAETWVAASDLIANLRAADGAAVEPAPASSVDSAPDAIAGRERDLRAALDRTFIILGAAESKRHSLLVEHLEEMRREVVHFSMRVIAFHTALESVRRAPDFEKHLPVVDSVFKALGDAARSVAVTLVTHRPENFAASEVRLRRCGHLIRVLDAELASASGDVALMQVRAALAQISAGLPRIVEKLGETVDYASMRSPFPIMLPELGTRSVQSLGAWINFDRSLDPVLVRYSARMAAMTMLAVALYKGFHIPRGYWIAFTIIVVLQPDYGATRERAGQRIGGTLAGILAGSALIWIRMPLPLLDIFATGTSFFFAYFVKRRYGVAIFFVTLLIVLVSETVTPVGLDFTVARLACTLLGGGMALLAALWFWPVWEGRKFPSLLAAAVRANAVFLDSMAPCFGLAATAENADPLMARRRAENANRYAAESLKRMTAEPSGRGTSATRVAALATYNQRITRALGAVAVYAEGGVTLRENSNIPGLMQEIRAALEALANCVEENPTAACSAALGSALEKIDARLALVHIAPRKETPDELSKTALVWTQLAKAIAEIRAMTLALDLPQPSPASTT